MSLVVSPGFTITPWQSYTPTTQGLGTPTTVEMWWRLVGDSVEIMGNLTSGTSTASELRIGLPNSYTSSSTKISSIRIAGVCITDNVDGGSNISTLFTLSEPSVTYITVGFRNSGNAPLTKQNGSGVIASGTKLSIIATVPVL